MHNTTAKYSESNGGGKLNDGLLKNKKCKVMKSSGGLGAKAGYGKASM